MPTKSLKPITERQQYWLKHLSSAEASGCSLVDYAKEHALNGALTPITHFIGTNT